MKQDETGGEEKYVLTLSKKQRPTSSGQSVYASSSFRNVLHTKQSEEMKGHILAFVFVFFRTELAEKIDQLLRLA